MEKNKKTKEALRKFEEKDDDESRFEYWESRKAFERTVENKMCTCQETAAEYINKLFRQKEVKKKNMGRLKEYHDNERIHNLCGISRMHKMFSRIVFCNE
jgi:predicted alpha-1,6-mannanase (GH76 family)